MGFSAIDYLVLAAYLIGITVFGSRFRASHRSVKDYFLGNRETSWIVISLVSSNIFVPTGVTTLTSSPSSLLRSARPIVDAVEIIPFSASASSGIT